MKKTKETPCRSNGGSADCLRPVFSAGASSDAHKHFHGDSDRYGCWQHTGDF
ncbi:hypothetical protein [Petralouisia muris]|uniref:hypothetical protein n=1 Tax=Petralouisia muris TaxID=3032872 RepID=UPI0023B87F9F|nr:hypothetical protein [Petralouisia muris]